MPRNVEIKARLADPDRTRARAAELADGPPKTLHQEDVFFRAPRGRWKLRTESGGDGELIHYERPDADGPKTSRYRLDPVDDADGLRRVLDLACGTRAVVRKKRELFLAGRTRIHVDEVEGLGWFLELEVVLEADESEATGEREAHELMRRLGVAADALVSGAYVDLLAPERG